MSSNIGKELNVSVFGQSHGKAIGVTIDGLPAGEAIDVNELQAFLDRRRPGTSELTTARNETDCPDFLAGVTEDSDGVVTTCDTRPAKHTGTSQNGTPVVSEVPGYKTLYVTCSANCPPAEGGAVTPLALAITLNGVAIPDSVAIVTPAAAEGVWHINTSTTINVPCNCCVSVSAAYVDATEDDAAVTPTPSIFVRRRASLEAIRVA